MKRVNRSKIVEEIEYVINAVKNRTLTREEFKTFYSLCREYGIGKNSFELNTVFNRITRVDELAEWKSISIYKSEGEKIVVLKSRMSLRAARQEGRRRRHASFQRLAQKGRV